MEVKRLIVASHNLNKIREIREITAHLNLQIVGLGELGSYPEVEEDGETFRENAHKKAVEMAKILNELVLADDSGLEVDALKGAPGVYSSRFAGKPGDDQANNRLLLEKLKGLELEKRGAQFRCVMALASPHGWVEYSEGVCRGQISTALRGKGGFGYDPLFLIPKYAQTFAEMDLELKNKISHRYIAMGGMLRILERL